MRLDCDPIDRGFIAPYCDCICSCCANRSKRRTFLNFLYQKIIEQKQQMNITITVQINMTTTKIKYHHNF